MFATPVNKGSVMLTKILSYYCRWIDSISKYASKLVMWLVLGMAAVFVWEVVLRGVFNYPTIWAHESSTYLFGAYFLLGGAYALQKGGMVNVDVLTHRLKPRTRAILDVVTGIVTLIFLAALTWKAFGESLNSIKILETSQTPWGPPMYPLRLTLAVGALLLGLQAVAKFIRDIMFSISGVDLT